MTHVHEVVQMSELVARAVRLDVLCCLVMSNVYGQTLPNNTGNRYNKVGGHMARPPQIFPDIGIIRSGDILMNH